VSSLTKHKSHIPDDYAAACKKQIMDNVLSSPDPTAPLTYETLPTPQSIRLLKLPRKEEFSLLPISGISVTIHTYALEDAPPFNALSYTWGKPYQETSDDDPESLPEFVRIIKCNGIKIKVTQNLFDGLVSFKQLGIGGFLWVDAVCINQADLNERSSKVLLMGEVYSQAENVLVWLGHHAEGIEEFSWATTDFLDLVQSPDDPTFVRSPYTVSGLLDEPFWVEHGLEWPAAKLVKVYDFYISCRWFSRMWVFQEVALAKNVRFFCGRTELSLQRTMLFAMLLRRVGWLSAVAGMASVNKGDAREWLTEILIVWNVTTQWDFGLTSDPVSGLWTEGIMNGPISELYMLLWLCRRYSCFDPRDKIYALLGFISRKLSRRSISIVNYVRPDYKTEANILFTNVMSFILSNSTTLDLVGDTRRSAPNLNPYQLPSWVIDFSSSKRASSATIFFKPVDTALCLSDIAPTFRVQGSILHCSGAVLDEISIIQYSNLEDSFRLAIDGRPLLRFFQFYLKVPYIVRGMPRLLLLCRTMIMGQSSIEGEDFELSQDLRLEADAFMKSYMIILLLHYSEHDANLMTGCSEVLDCFLDSESAAEREIVEYIIERGLYTRQGNGSQERLTEEDLDKLLISLDNACAVYNISMNRALFRRRLYITKRGFLGMGLETIQEGDQVWLLCDARVPMVLRPTKVPDEFTVVGECYLHEFMNGEMLNEEWGVKENIHPIKII
jgi:hypothetical protein